MSGHTDAHVWASATDAELEAASVEYRATGDGWLVEMADRLDAELIRRETERR